MTGFPGEPFSPRSLKNDGEALLIEWSDGVTHRLRWEMLRNNCPCASCRTKQEAPPLLLPVLKVVETQPVTATVMQSVGNYAYSIHFSDGHNTGIFSLESLRRLGAGQGASEAGSESTRV